MSDSDEFSQIEERIESLLEYESEIMRVDNLVIDSFEEHLRQFREIPNQNVLADSLNTILSIEIESEESVNVVFTLLNTVLQFDSDHIHHLKDQEASRDFIDFLQSMSTKYQLDVLEMKRKNEDGELFYRHDGTELTRRANGRVGMNYRGYLGRSSFEFSTSLPSNLDMIRHLVNGQSRAMDEFPQDAYRELERDFFDVLQESISDLRDKYTNIEKIAEEEGWQNES